MFNSRALGRPILINIIIFLTHTVAYTRSLIYRDAPTANLLHAVMFRSTSSGAQAIASSNTSTRHAASLWHNRSRDKLNEFPYNKRKQVATVTVVSGPHRRLLPLFRVTSRLTPGLNMAGHVPVCPRQKCPFLAPSNAWFLASTSPQPNGTSISFCRTYGRGQQTD